MRSTLLAMSLLVLTAVTATASAEVDHPPVAPELAVAAQADPTLTAPAAPAVEPATGGAACQTLTAPSERPLAGGFNNQCGDPCTPPPWWQESECVGYDCRGILVIGRCTCQDDTWTCSWQEACS